MTEPVLLDQPYPNLLPWRSMEHLLEGGWSAQGAARHASAMVEHNTVHLSMVLTAGPQRRIMTLPEGMVPAKTQTFPALFRGYGMVEVQIRAAMSHMFVMGPDWPGEEAAGSALLFTQSFQRSA